MSPLSSSPSNPHDVRVLYFGQFTDDDFMWSIDCKVAWLFDMLQDPQTTVDQLDVSPEGLVPDESLGSKVHPALLSPFNIQLSLYVPPLGHGGRIVVEGISETGILRVLASESAATAALRPILEADLTAFGVFEAVDPSGPVPPVESLTVLELLSWYWKIVEAVLGSQDVEVKKVHVLLSKDTNSWFGHLCVYNDAWELPLEFRDAWISAYLLARLIDPIGYTGLLNTLTHQVSSGPYAATDDDLDGVIFVPAADGFSSAYASTTDTTTTGCDALWGNYVTTPNGTIVFVQNATVKNYK